MKIDFEKYLLKRGMSKSHIKRMEDNNNIDFRADGSPEEITDDEAEKMGYEI